MSENTTAHRPPVSVGQEVRVLRCYTNSLGHEGRVGPVLWIDSDGDVMVGPDTDDDGCMATSWEVVETATSDPTVVPREALDAAVRALRYIAEGRDPGLAAVADTALHEAFAWARASGYTGDATTDDGMDEAGENKP